MTTAFSHLDPGTAEAVWRDEIARRTLRPLHTAFEVLVVVAAHPDDETLGAGGLLRRAARIGARIVVVIATDGEASHPDSRTHDRTTLAKLRREEVTRAVATLAPDADVRFLGLPDGALDERKGELRERLVAILDALRTVDPRRVLVVSPWADDRHRDHRIAAEITGAVGAHRRFTHLEFPIWAWHWGGPADVPWNRVVALSLTDDERQKKSDALACHATQISPLSDQPGDEALLHPGMQEHFHRDIEIFLSPEPEEAPQLSLDARWFDEFYRRNPGDPWGFESRWYEQRKRALLMATLPAYELGSVLEIGCATGLLTAGLAARADAVIAMDAAATAVEIARARLRADTRVSVRHGRVPEDWPAGRFDTIVFSEVGYYFGPADLQRTLTRIDTSLADQGHVVACHWRHPVAEYPQTGDDVHEALRAVPGWETVSLHVEEDFVLELFARSPARSVAEQEGLV